jgi:5,10-methylenetetrahydrofolate reductase
MKLKDKLRNEAAAVTLFEMVPPAEGRADAIARSVEEVKRIRALADAINLPEIRDENRGEARTFKFIPRLEPRKLAARLVQETGAEVLINRGVVYDAGQLEWFRETRERFGIETVVLVGGESSRIQYPGPSVLEAAGQVRSAGLPLTLGGITIPSRLGEAERIRRKTAAGLVFFTTQVLFDSNDIVGLVQSLNGIEARILLSFAPVSRPQDLEFLRWLGVDVPKNLDQFLFQGGGVDGAPLTGGESKLAAPGALARSLDIAQRILLDVFDNLPPDPPLLGLNVMHINQRNFAPAVQMLERLGHLYSNLVAARERTSLA